MPTAERPPAGGIAGGSADLPMRSASHSKRRSARARRTAIVSRPATLGGVAPALLVIAVVLGGGIVQAVVVSLSNWQGIGPVDVTGFSNYSQILSDPNTLTTLKITIEYALATAIGIVVLATVLAAAVSAGVRGSSWYRVIWFLPGIAPGAAVAIFWTTSFQPRFGAVNILERALGGSGNSALLADPSTALIPIIIVSVWAGVGFAFLLLLGAMEQIPTDLYEAAGVDGASRVRQFFAITLPLARPVLVTTLMLEIIWAFNGFTLVWAMTRGGPGNATATLPVVVYQDAFSFAQYGPAAALAVIGSIILIAVGAVGLRLSRSAQL
jgi:raffinose/stachyose/melibiose transport system permease protein